MAFKKKIAAILLVAVFLLTSGTFAWMSATQSKANEFRGDAPDTSGGGSLHDDFCQPKKDVYVENWGKNDIFVRVRLDEYMELGSGAGLKGMQDGSGNWIPSPDNHAVSILPGANINDKTTWRPHVPDPTVEVCNNALDFHKYWTWQMGGQKYYMPVSSANQSDPMYVASDPTVYNSFSPGVKQTLDSTGKVITMDQWHALGNPIGPYWVLDTDGWAYWAQALAPDTATGLLLHMVSLTKQPPDAYYYAINVLAQMATKDGDENYNNFGDGADADHNWTQDGHDLMDLITGNGSGGGGGGVSGVTITSNNGTMIGDRLYLPQGQSANLTATVTGGANNNVTWQNNNAAGFTFNSFGNSASVQTTASTAIGSKLSVGATSVDDTSKSAAKTIVTIDPDAKGVVVGGDGNLYLDYGDNTFRKIDQDGNPIGNLICGGMDQKPGTADDRTDVVITKDGTKLLGPNPDGSYQAKGPDGKLGTADDTFWWKKPGNESKPIGDLTFTGDETGDFTQTPPSQITVRNIVVDPTSVSLYKGDSQQFTATAYMSDGSVDPNGVTWSVLPATDASITQNGMLTVSGNATATALMVVATSKTNTTVYTAAIVNINTETVTSVTITSNNGTMVGDRLYLPQGQVASLVATVNGSPRNIVTWQNSGAAGFTFNSSDNVATVQAQTSAAAGSKLTVSATSVADSSKSAVKTVVVIPEGTKVVIGGDGNPYLDYGDNTFKKIDQDGNPIGDFICGGMDQKPGTADDRTDVVITKDGTKLLGPNPDGSYQAKGPDGKLGTADDTFWWKKPGNESKPIGDLTFTGDETGDFTQTPPVQTTVRNIIIDPASAELFKGDSQQFNATEYMSDGTSSPANNDVTWSVQPSSDATITPDGLLTVKPTATATSITVVAVSKANPAVTQTVTVTVKPDIDATPTVVDGRILTTDLTGDTANWVEIARSGKYSLIIRQDYIQVYSGNNAPDWNYISFGSSGNYIGSNVQSKINAWFNTSSSAPMKLAAGARLRTFTVSNNAAGVLGSGSVTAGLTNGYSKPNTLKSGDGNDIAFALSYGEAANFCSRTYWIRSANPAYQPSDALAAKNLGKLTAHGAGGNMNDGLGIWLRSSGDITGTACVIGYGSNTVGLGDVFQYQLNPYQQGSGYRETAGVYPALWVDSSIFNK